MGNRLTKSDTVVGATTSTTSLFDAANHLASTSGMGAGTYTSDAGGNTFSDGGCTNIWDSQNRLVSCLVGAVPTSMAQTACAAVYRGGHQHSLRLRWPDPDPGDEKGGSLTHLAF